MLTNLSRKSGTNVRYLRPELGSHELLPDSTSLRVPLGPVRFLENNSKPVMIPGQERVDPLGSLDPGHDQFKPRLSQSSQIGFVPEGFSRD
jgi:hypothetical protein